jgi:DNA-binding MarR family transcriptional regulator
MTVVDTKPEAPPLRGRKRRYLLREETVGFLIWEARRAYARDFGALIAEHGVSFGVFPVLRILWDEDALTQSEIIRRAGMKGPTIVGIVAQLEAAGLIRRIQDPNDGRKRSIALTREGDALRHVIMPIAEDVNRRALKGFSAEERQSLKAMLRRVRGNLSVEDQARGSSPRAR